MNFSILDCTWVMQVSILYSFKTSSNTFCWGTVCFRARQAPAACQSSTSSLLVAHRKQTRFSFLLPFNRSLFHVWKLETRVFQCAAWMCVCVWVCPLAHLFLISWLESISHQKKQKNNFSLTCCSFPLPSWFHWRSVKRCRARIEWDVQLILCWVLSALVVVISSIRNLLEKSLCWGKSPVI